MSKGFKNILIIKPSSLGDIVLALPVLSGLRSSFPDAKISWLIRPDFAPLLENHPHLDEIVIFDRKLLGKGWYNPRALASLLVLIRRLRHSSFDAVFDLQGLFRTASLCWLTGCKKRFGMLTAREYAHIFYTHKVSQDKDCIHLVDYYLKIIKAACPALQQGGAGASAGRRPPQGVLRTVDNVDVQFILPQTDAAADSVGRLLAGHGIRSDGYAVLIPGSAHSDKCWPTERFAALADKISSRFGLSIITTGSAAEEGIVEKLQKLSNVPIVNLAGQTSLSELVALLRAARLVVSNDTGPGHIAAALGVPLVLIFGRSNPARVAPFRRSQCVVAVEPDSRGLKRNSTNPKHDIKAVTVDDVYRKVCEQLDL